jgi:perosamine synthetase
MSIGARRKEIFSAYRKMLQGIPGIDFQPCAPWAEPASWLFCITVDKKVYGRSRDELMFLLAENGIETRPFFLSLHKLPPFREASRNRGEQLPVTDQLSAIGMNLPTYNGLEANEIERIVTAIRKGCKNRR